MKSFKLILVLSLGLLFSTNSLVVASVNNCDCVECCGCNNGCCCCCNVSYANFYSPDNNYCVYKNGFSNSVFVENVARSRDIIEFRDLVSFSFSKDSKYLLVERSEFNTKINAQNDYIEVFDLFNGKRIFFMPFYKKCYPAQNYYSNKSYDIDDLVYLNFYGDILQSVEFDFEGNYIFVPANLYNVSSVYASQLGIGLSVKFNDGSIKVYIPTKDFYGFNEVFSFGKSVMASELVRACNPDICY